MPLPTIEVQTRTHQQQLMRARPGQYVWMLGVRVNATMYYPQARKGDKVMALAVHPQPYLPYFEPTQYDPRSEPMIQLFLVEVDTDLALEVISVSRETLASIAQERVVYRWPDQLYLVTLDTICPACGMVTTLDGFEMSCYQPSCDPQWCLKESEHEPRG